MAKTSTKDRGSTSQVQRISTVDNPSQGGNFFFIAGLGLIVVAGIAAVAVLASNRSSNLGVAPEAQLDHWHSAFSIYDCGVELPPTGNFEAPRGLHTHGDGLLHLHPTSPVSAGANASLRNYLDAYDAEVTDDTFTPGFADSFRDPLSESAGCDGGPAELQLAIWDDPLNLDAEPTVITEGIADFKFTRGGQAITLALVAEGETAPPPSEVRILQLADTGSGDADHQVLITPELDPSVLEDGDDAESDDAESESDAAESDAAESDETTETTEAESTDETTETTEAESTDETTETTEAESTDESTDATDGEARE